ncbi:hypothetical protein S40288_11106 [Stachybotrys chartarum IBT 40288]|nr:hypothetical protein S40288_11106 [Stachybotrys chartarum IBT 40288]
MVRSTSSNGTTNGLDQASSAKSTGVPTALNNQDTEDACEQVALSDTDEEAPRPPSPFLRDDARKRRVEEFLSKVPGYVKEGRARHTDHPDNRLDFSINRLPTDGNFFMYKVYPHLRAKVDDFAHHCLAQPTEERQIKWDQLSENTRRDISVWADGAKECFDRGGMNRILLLTAWTWTTLMQHQFHVEGSEKWSGEPWQAFHNLRRFIPTDDLDPTVFPPRYRQWTYFAGHMLFSHFGFHSSAERLSKILASKCQEIVATEAWDAEQQSNFDSLIRASLVTDLRMEIANDVLVMEMHDSKTGKIKGFPYVKTGTGNSWSLDAQVAFEEGRMVDFIVKPRIRIVRYDVDPLEFIRIDMTVAGRMLKEEASATDEKDQNPVAAPFPEEPKKSRRSSERLAASKAKLVQQDADSETHSGKSTTVGPMEKPSPRPGSTGSQADQHGTGNRKKQKQGSKTA